MYSPFATAFLVLRNSTGHPAITVPQYTLYERNAACKNTKKLRGLLSGRYVCRHPCPYTPGNNESSRRLSYDQNTEQTGHLCHNTITVSISKRNERWLKTTDNTTRIKCCQTYASKSGQKHPLHCCDNANTYPDCRKIIAHIQKSNLHNIVL